MSDCDSDVFVWKETRMDLEAVESDGEETRHVQMFRVFHQQPLLSLVST